MKLFCDYLNQYTVKTQKLDSLCNTAQRCLTFFFFLTIMTTYTSLTSRAQFRPTITNLCSYLLFALICLWNHSQQSQGTFIKLRVGCNCLHTGLYFHAPFRPDLVSRYTTGAMKIVSEIQCHTLRPPIYC